jgi:hypothetical protein
VDLPRLDGTYSRCISRLLRFGEAGAKRFLYRPQAAKIGHFYLNSYAISTLVLGSLVRHGEELDSGCGYHSQFA